MYQLDLITPKKQFMKPLISITLILFFSACTQEHFVSNNATEFEKNIKISKEKSESTLTEEYQLVQPHVKFYRNESNPQLGFQLQMNFIEQSGLPLQPQFFPWSESNNVNKAMDLYKNYIKTETNHAYINVFRQYQGWLLLTHYSMLSPNSKSSGKDVSYILDQLIISKYEGYELIYHTLEYLKKINISKEDLSSYAKQIFAYAKESEQQKRPGLNDLKTGGKPVDPEIIEMVNKHLREKNQAHTFLNKIQQFL